MPPVTPPSPALEPPRRQSARLPGWLRRGSDRCAALAPGLLLAAVVALAATFAAQWQGAAGSPLVYALLLGAALHWTAEAPRAHPGLAWGAGPLLRIGVGLLGARLAVGQLLALGSAPLAATALAMLTTLALGLGLARALRLPWPLGLLAGGANAICGASATLAIAAVLPRDAGAPQLHRHALVVAACATAYSTLAMLLYPWLAQAMSLPPAAAGIFLGGSIQDVAQVVAAGYAAGPLVGDTAVALKLARVALLGPIVALVAAAMRRRAATPGDGRPGLPLGLPGFVWLFFALMALNSAGALPPPLQHLLGQASQACVTVAIAALGMRLSLRELARSGWRPFVLMGLLAAWIAAAMALTARHAVGV